MGRASGVILEPGKWIRPQRLAAERSDLDGIPAQHKIPAGLMKARAKHQERSDAGRIRRRVRFHDQQFAEHILESPLEAQTISSVKTTPPGESSQIPLGGGEMRKK